MYDGVVHGKPLYHDGAWGRATLEVCSGIIESARTRREVSMRLQVPIEQAPSPQTLRQTIPRTGDR